jgi:hypothetical protein
VVYAAPPGVLANPQIPFLTEAAWKPQLIVEELFQPIVEILKIKN